MSFRLCNWGVFAFILNVNVLYANANERDDAIKQFTLPPSLQQITISPDGKHLAAVVNVEGNERMVILERGTQKIAAYMAFKRGEVVDRIRWANDERVLVTNAKKISRLDQKVSTGELYAVNVDGKQSRLLFGYRASNDQPGKRLPSYASQEILSVETEYANEILIAVYPWDNDDEGTINYVARLNIYNGREKNIIRAPMREAHFISDHLGKPRFAVGQDKEDLTQVYLRDDENEKWVKMGGGNTEATYVPIGFDQTTQQPYWFSDDIADTRGIYRYDPTDAKSDLIYRHDHIDPQIDDLFFSPKGEMLWVDIADGVTPTHYINSKHQLSQLHRGLTLAFPELKVEFTSITRDGKEIVAYVHGASDPGAFYIVNTETRKAEFISEPYKWINPETLAKVLPVKIETRDKYPLNGFITRAHSVKEPGPMVVLVHGGPHQADSQDQWRYDAEVQLLANQGFTVLQVNFRGSFGYGNAHLFAGFRQWGRLMQNDVTDATHWAIAQGFADPNRICIYGTSYGGYSAMMGLITASDLYRCGISYAGVSDLSLMHEEGDIPERHSGRLYLERVIGVDQEELKRWSPVYRAKEIKAPVLLMHGGKDERVPIEHAERLEQALKAENKSVETLYYPFESHGFFDQQHQMEAYRKLLDFLHKHTTVASP